MEEEKGQRSIQREQELKSIQTERAASANVERNLASETLVYTREILQSLREQSKNLEGQTDLKRSLNTLATNINKAAQQSADTTARKLFLLESERDIEKEITQNQRNRERLVTEADAAERQIRNIKAQNKNIQREINQLEKDGQSEKAESLKNELSSNDKLVKTLQTAGVALRDLINDTDNFAKRAEQAKDSFVKISELPSSQMFEGLTRSFGKIPVLGDFLEKAKSENLDISKERQVSLQDLQERISSGKGLTEKYYKESGLDTSMLKGGDGKTLTGTAAASKLQGQKNLSSLLPEGNAVSKSLGAAFKSLGPIIKKALGPLGLILEFVQGIMQADKEIVELQKSFALNTREAMALRTSIADAAAESGNINITTTKLLANITELSKEFGFVAQFSNDTLVTMTKLTTQVGLTAKEAAQLAAAAEITDTSFEDIYQNVLGASYELQQQAGVQFDLREILKATNSVTGQVRANLAANPEAIATAVTQAKLFGAELDDIVGSSKALLQFEDSIRNELQAELLLGRDLNLERARSAALLGDQETVAKELAAQAQDFTSFTKLNVLQQDALASSLGMQSDQLSDILFKQEVQNKTARELRALGKDELANRLEQQTLADQFNATIEKLKGIFTDVATALVPLLRGLGAVLSLAGAIVGLVGDLFNLLRGDADFSGLKAGLSGFAGSLGFTSMDDGMIPPAGEGPILQRPEGSIQFNPDDTIIAGTDLFSGEVTPEIPDKQEITQKVIRDLDLSEMPDYKDIIKETRLGNVFNNNQIQQGNNVQTSESTSETRIEPIQSSIQTIKEMQQAPMVAPKNTASDTLISELIAEQKKTQEAIMAQTRVLSKGQDTIAKTKTKLQVGATDFGTELNVNSFRIQ